MPFPFPFRHLSLLPFLHVVVPSYYPAPDDPGRVPRCESAVPVGRVEEGGRWGGEEVESVKKKRKKRSWSLFAAGCDGEGGSECGEESGRCAGAGGDILQVELTEVWRLREPEVVDWN